MEKWEELLESSDKYMEVMESVFALADDGLLLTNAEGVCLKINPAFTRISGLTQEQLIGVNHNAMVMDGAVRNSCVLQVIAEERRVTKICDYPITGRRALVTGVPLMDEYGKLELVVTSARDVTELNDLEKQLEQEQALRRSYERQIETMQDQVLLSDSLVAVDKTMRDVVELANRVSRVTANLLISGESGVGKEELAKYIHMVGARKDKPFVAINCGAIPESLIESELFGYEPGAFTGALKTGKAGLIEAADHGTLFLDEIGELPLAMQVRFLRVLQNREITRVGGKNTVPVDVRVIAASHRNLYEMVREGTFREDLYYRLNVVPIRIPPLRERREDIIPLAKRFIGQINKQYDTQKTFSGMAFRELYEYSWPGNVRELRNLIERVMVISESDTITAQTLALGGRPLGGQKDMPSEGLKERMERIEYEYIEEAYRQTDSMRKAAKVLHMTPTTYMRKREFYIKKFGSSAPEGKNRKE